MADLDQFLTTAAVAAGTLSAELKSPLAALEVYLADFPSDDRLRAPTEARQGLNAWGIDGSVRNALVREIDLRMAGFSAP